jgi:hypothetical protein
MFEVKRPDYDILIRVKWFTLLNKRIIFNKNKNYEL